ncbi:MAG: DUF3885 domain-containing protein [Bacteroidia bacterium]
MNIDKFKQQYTEYFGNNQELKVVFEMGGNKRGKNRIFQIEKRFNEIADWLLDDKEFWIILTVWNTNLGTMSDLLKSGFNLNSATNIFKGDKLDKIVEADITNNDEVFYLYYDSYKYSEIKPLIESIAAFEIGIEPSANINAYIVSFDKEPFFLNLYDDRGMEFLCHDNILFNNIKARFELLIQK